MNKNLHKVIFLSIAASTAVHTHSTVWHDLEVSQEAPEAMGDQAMTVELKPKTVREEIKANDFIQNNRTQEQLNQQVKPSKFSASISTGMITSGQAKETVYLSQDGSNLSLLTWDIKNSPTIKTDFTWNIFPWLEFNINGWTTFSSNNTTMNDYDWLDPKDRSNTTDWSHHSNTRLNSANHFDLNATAWLLNKPAYKLGILTGYQEERFSWTAKGGDFKYSQKDSNNNYIDGTSQSILGYFYDDITVIGYKQKFRTPYIGLVGQYQSGNLALSGGLKFSQWAKASAQDQHYLRSLTGTGKTTNGDYFSATVNAGYYIMPYTKLFTEITWTEYKRNLGQTTRTQGKKTDYLNQNEVKEGIANRYLGVNAGLQYDF